MTRSPALLVDAARNGTSAVALVLHGGRERSTGPVRPHQLAVLRMLPFARSLRTAGTRRGLAVARLRYRARGWNEANRDPVPDTLWALDRLRERFGEVPIALVGHSMGGRAAIHTADHPSVTTVVGLAPWVATGDPVSTMSGRRLLAVHGDADRMTSPAASAQYVRDAAPIAAAASFVSIRGEHHPMLRQPRLWHDLTTGFVLDSLLDLPPEGTVGDAATNILLRALAGEGPVVV